MTRTISWALGTWLADVVMQQRRIRRAGLIGGTLKIVYDVALYRAIRHLKPPEE